MKRGLLIALGITATVGAGAYYASMPKIGRATRAEIEAALPNSLKFDDPAEPRSQARYGRALQIVRQLATDSNGFGSKAAQDGLSELGRVLEQGSLQVPSGDATDRFADGALLRMFSKRLANETVAAARRGDLTNCRRLGTLGLRFGTALIGSKGMVIDLLADVAVENVATQGIYDAEMAGGFDEEGRSAMLALLPPLSMNMTEFGGAVRRDFRWSIPFLMNPNRFVDEQSKGDPSADRSAVTAVGTYDPLKTAKLIGRIYDETIQNCARPPFEQTKLPRQIAFEASRGLPREGRVFRTPPGFQRAIAQWRYRLEMNNGDNTLGRRFASMGLLNDVAAMAAKRAANRNLVRAVLLLRMGKNADLADPYGKGTLRVDSVKRRVWSVGADGKDNGGDFDELGSARTPDFGYRY